MFELEESRTSDFFQLPIESNCGIPGIYLFRLNQYPGGNFVNLATEPKTIPGVGDLETTTVRADFSTVTAEPIDLSDLPEPFLLPFGPQHNDSFTRKMDDGCSDEQFLSRRFRFGSLTFDSLYVCTNGHISFGSGNSILWWSSSDTFITPFLADADIEENIFDYGCFDSSYPGWRENICNLYHRLDQYSSGFYNHYINSYVGDPNLEQAIEDWNAMSFRASELNVRRDDELTLLLMRRNTTKYVNLVNNIMKREVTSQSDLDILTDLIDDFEPNFEASFAYVVTFYKNSRYPGILDEVNSYQVVIVCDNFGGPWNRTQDHCFCLFDYFEITWDAVSSARAGFNTPGKILFTCVFLCAIRICRVTFNFPVSRSVDTF